MSNLTMPRDGLDRAARVVGLEVIAFDEGSRFGVYSDRGMIHYGDRDATAEFLREKFREMMHG